MTNDKILNCLKKGFICKKFKSFESFKKNSLAWGPKFVLRYPQLILS